MHASPERLIGLVAGIFTALKLPADAARVVAEALVDADLEGIPSHGLMLLPMYAERIRAGSVSVCTEAVVASDRGSAIVLDAQNMLGQLSSRQAVQLLIGRAPVHGLAAVAVRNGFHFGTAGKWAADLAAHGLLGIVMSNTRPLMPAPGGAERVVGNNPLAIAIPAAGREPVVFDMASSASAMGKIRLAAGAGQPIPEGWATDAKGQSTTDAAEAIKGMLLPAAGPKGFGLAFMIDLLCGGLSSGAIADAVHPLYGDPALTYGCAHFFLAIDVEYFCPRTVFEDAAGAFAGRVEASARAPGVERVFAPGGPAIRTRLANATACPLAADTVKQLTALASSLGVSTDNIFQNA